VRFFKPNVEKLSTKRDVTGLIEALGDSDRSIRSEAGAALAKLGAPASEALAAALRHRSALVRGAAAHALGHMRDAQNAPLLIAALEDVPEVRASARESLAVLGAAAVEPLLAALRQAKPRVREAAAELLGEIADPRAFKPLLEATNDADPAVAGHAAFAVERFRRVQDALVEDLLNPTLDVRRSVTPALEALGWEPGRDEYGAAYWAAKCRWDQCLAVGLPAVKPLIQAILGVARPGEQRDEERRAAAMALAALGQPAVRAVLAAAQSAHYPDDTDALLQTLAYVTDPAALDDLVLLVAGNAYGQRFAARALVQIGDERAVEPLANAVADAGRPEEVRIDAAKALGRIRDPRGIEALLAVLTYGVHRPALESAVVAALAAFGDRRACGPVIEALFRQPRNEYGWAPLAEALRPLFGGYTDAIVDLAGYTVQAGGSQLRFIVERNARALAALCGGTTPVTTNLLHQVHDALGLKSNFLGASRELERDFRPLKRRAADELERRGNPPFDAAVYLDAAAWNPAAPAR
jgi:HEAT repeat protein